MMVERPRRNRMTPFGILERSEARGAVMGNRGDLHDRRTAEIVRPWRGRRWIICTTVGKGGWRVPFDQAGRYTPLFALDEATMLAAGHRPCAQCRPEAYARFVAAWARAHTMPYGYAPSAGTLDATLHTARLNDEGRQRTHQAQVGDLPDGVLVAIPAPNAPGQSTACLMWSGRFLPWSHGGYGQPEPFSAATIVDVLTPEPIVAVLRAGYVPEVAI